MAKIEKFKLLISFIIGTILFIAGFLASNWIVLFGYQRNIELQQRIGEKINLMDSESQIYCENYQPEISTELNEAGSFLMLLEKKFGKNKPEIILQKENYSMLELKHFFSVKNYAQKCQKSITTLLFFYSNKEDYLDDAETKGFIISKLKELNPAGIMAYSFDYDLDSDVIRNLKDAYNVQKPNTAVINDKIILEQFNDIDDLTPYTQAKS